MADARIEIPADDGGLDAIVACPDGRGPWAPIVLFAPRQASPAEVEALAQRLAGGGAYVLAPAWAASRDADLAEDAEAWFDHLADDPRAEDARVGLVGFGAGADLALQVAGWHAERIAAVAAYGGQGLGPAAATDVAQRLNAVIRIGYPMGGGPARVGVLEAAFAIAGVDFEIEVYDAEPDWPGLRDLFARTLAPPQVRLARAEGGDFSTDARLM